MLINFIKQCIIIYMKLFKNRILPGFIFLTLMLVIMIPMAIYGPTNFEARIASYVFSACAFIVLCYEYFKAHHIKWYVNFLFILVILPTVIFPIKNFNELIIFSLKTKREWHSFFIENIARDWFTLLILLGVSIAFTFVEFAERNNMSLEDRFVRAITMMISLYLIIISIKTIQLTLILKWEYTILIFAIPTCCDIFGYLGGSVAGKKWIKQPFAPTISPKKTWEGFIFAILFGISTGLGLILGFKLLNNNIFAQITASIFMPVFAILGDLYFSYIKRINAIKDYSKILLSHGGVLDRFDSVSFSTFFFLISYVIFGL
ncbi:phosphatidate cytidylyltransferase [Mycoplasmopsis caviae]|uniref:Phosphatidate cytidylyltransferase n=2 Tax=Mycoplasmopsis caviae TaxID=55603 RepID=A0ABY5J0R5_9BACT|nr:phosphatidate cytidylyltransferase [Mycoplasmopsis caviae]UUD35242.1 phosphatidate cytidylyltransferase [Mycoplasmopsis caviae]